MWRAGALPTGALIANVVWATVNLSLAQAVLGFTARLSRFRRREYRFPVPLPAVLDFAGGTPVVGVLDDISSHGFKFYGRFPAAAAAVGAHVRGEIRLPSGTLPCRAEVRSLIHADSPPATSRRSAAASSGTAASSATGSTCFCTARTCSGA